MRSLLLVLLAALALPACATRTVSETVVDHYDLEIRLRSEKKMFGRAAIPRGFAQPAEIAPARLETILGGIQIDLRPSDDSPIRERQYAIPRKLLPEVAAGLSEAFAAAGPDQEIVVLALRKQMQKGIFNRKYLTSFVTWIEGDALVVQLSRVDWRTDQQRETDKLPVPQVGEVVMPFSTVPSELYTVAGRQGVKVDWRSPAFGGEAIGQNVVGGTRPGADAASGAPVDGAAPVSAGAAAGATGPATAAGATSATATSATSATAAGATSATAAGATSATAAGATSATAAGSAPVAGAIAAPAAGAAAAGTTTGTAATAAAAAEESGASDALRGLSADDLRRLADLEDARASGRIDEAGYEAERRAILQPAR